METVSSEGCHVLKKLIFTERVAEIGFAKKLDETDSREVKFVTFLFCCTEKVDVS